MFATTADPHIHTNYIQSSSTSLSGAEGFWVFLSLNLGNSKREGEKKKKKSGVSEILLSRSEDFETGRNKDRDSRERERERGGRSDSCEYISAGGACFYTICYCCLLLLLSLRLF